MSRVCLLPISPSEELVLRSANCSLCLAVAVTVEPIGAVTKLLQHNEILSSSCDQPVSRGERRGLPSFMTIALSRQR